MINHFNKKAQKEIRNRVKTIYQKINVTSGMCRYNFMCYMNAVHDAWENKENKLAMVIYFYHKQPILHFINYTVRDGKEIYTDNTLGRWSSRHDYYLIRLVDESEFNDIEEIFNKYREETRRNLSFWVRIFSNYIV